MITLLKYLLKNIWEKKLRSLLIILAVGITTAMTFASFGAADNFRVMVTEKSRANFGNANILITHKDDGKNSFVDKVVLDKELKKDEKAFLFNGTGVYDGEKNKEKINILGGDAKELDLINPIVISNQNKDFKVESLNKNEVIVDENFYKENNLKLGDKIKLKTEGKYIELKIAGIAAPVGFFTKKAGESTFVVDNECLKVLLNREEIYTSCIVNSNFNEFKETKKDLLKEYDIAEILIKESLDQIVSGYVVPFYIMLIVVVLMAAFIIYSSFKIIVIERIGVIGTFRSIGATKKVTDFLILLESFLYGILGCVFGSILGIPILYFLSDSSNVYKDMGIKTSMVINYENIVIACVISLLICMLSSVIPVLSLRNNSIKDIIIGKYETYTKENNFFCIFGIFLIIWPVAYIKFSENPYVLILTLLCAFSFILGIAMIMPIILKVVSKTLKPIYNFMFGNIGILSLNNLSSSKILINNAMLLTCSLAAVSAIFISSYSVKGIITKEFKDSFYKIEVSNINAYNYENILSRLGSDKKTNNIDTYNNYLENDVKLVDYKISILELKGIDTTKYSDFFREDIENIDETFNELDKGKNIILSDIFKKKYNLKVNDFIKLNIKDKDIEYKIVGFLESPISSNKRRALISSQNLKEDFNKKVPDSILIKQDDIEEDALLKRLNDELIDYGVNVKTKENLERVQIKNNLGIMNSLESFSIMALIIGSLGIANNLMVSFIKRKKEFAIFCSVGMSKDQKIKMVIIEALTIGIVGSCIGVLCGTIVTEFIPYITLSLDTYLNIEIPKDQIMLLWGLGIAIMFISSIPPLLKATKLSIVQEIKYE